MKIKGNVITGNAVQPNLSYKTSLAAPIMVSYDITNRCNFKCLHCFNHSGEDKFDDELNNIDKMEAVKQIIELNPYLVCICGGETTCCDNLFEILSKLTSKIPIVNIVSNGYMIDENYAERLKATNITGVQISLDGINAEQHDTFRGHYGAFDHAIAAIKNLKNVGINVMIALVPNKLNYKDTYDYFKLCRDLGAMQSRCMPFLPMGRGGDIGSNLLLTKEEDYVFRQSLLKAKEDFKDITIEWGDPIDHTYRMPDNAKLGIDSYSMDIRSNGDIGVSAYFPISVGNIKRHSLKEYWDAGYNKIWQNNEIVEIMKLLENVSDFSKLATLKKYDIDLIEGENYELHYQ